MSRFEMQLVINKQVYSNYADSKKDLVSKLKWFVNEKGLSLEDYELDNYIMVSKIGKKGVRYIYDKETLLNYLKIKYEKGKIRGVENE